MSLWLASDGRWKWHSYEAGKRVLRSADTLDKAKRRAAEHLRALRDGKTALLGADAATVSEFLAWRAQRVESPKLADAVASYIRHLVSRGVTETRIIEGDLTRFAEAHDGTMAEVTPDQVTRHLDTLAVGARRRNNVRAHLVGLFRWARLQGLLPDATTAPERVHPAKLTGAAVEVYTPAQFRALLAAAPEGWRLALAIGGLAGLRSEEIAGLRWEDLLPSRKLILVRAEICKTGRRRFVPICPALMAWIKASQPQEAEMVAPRERIDHLSTKLRRAGVHWVKNGLRHSFGSYRCAIVKSAGQVALEMGNSETIVRRHYLEAQDARTAREWFAAGPKKT